ncbi:PEP-CTERM sorting domain-containing protein [Isosphaeraceae bacterium EP7]
MQIAEKLKAITAVAAVALAIAAPAKADQVGQFIQLAPTPTFTFTNLGTVGGSIIGADIKPGLYVDAVGGGSYSASTSLNLQYVSDDTYKGSFSIIATAASGTIAVGDVLFSATYTAILSGGIGSLSLNNVSTDNVVSALYTNTFSDLVTGFTFTNIQGNVSTASSPITGSATGNGLIAISGTIAAVPEPGSMVMFGLGMLAPFALLARRSS